MPSSHLHRVSRTLQEQRRRWAAVRFGLLATTLMLSMAVLMIAAPLVHSSLPLQIAVFAPLFVGVYVVSENTRFVVMWGTALVLVSLLGVIAALREEPGLLILDLGMRCILWGALMISVAREMLRDAHVSLDTILGGICLYIMIGYLYTLLYFMLLVANPTSLVIGGQPLGVSSNASHPLEALSGIVYFSFTAFTTMGFGDIIPTTALARYATITEGMLGQLFPAIFIARLVSLNLTQTESPTTGS